MYIHPGLIDTSYVAFDIDDENTIEVDFNFNSRDKSKMKLLNTPHITKFIVGITGSQIHKLWSMDSNRFSNFKYLDRYIISFKIWNNILHEICTIHPMYNSISMKHMCQMFSDDITSHNNIINFHNDRHTAPIDHINTYLIVE